MKVKNKKRKANAKNANKKTHLTYEERVKIESLIKEGFSYQRIATNLNRGKATIYLEIKRNKGWFGYNAKKANHRAYVRQYRKKKGCNSVAMSIFLKRFVEEKLRLGWSPERISDRLKLLKHKLNKEIEYVSAKSIRKYIQKRPGLETLLLKRRMKKKGGPKRGKWLKDNLRRFVDIMPEIKGFGTFEVDFIVSSKSAVVLLVLVDVVTKLTLIRKLPNRINVDVNTAIVEMLEPYPKTHTLIPDNDIAFAKWEDLAKQTKTDIFFARPFRSTDKPLVENTNGTIRTCDIPKKKDLGEVSDEHLLNIQNWINHTPRQCLGGHTPWERYQKELGRDILEKSYPRHPVLSPLSATSFVFGGR